MAPPSPSTTPKPRTIFSTPSCTFLFILTLTALTLYTLLHQRRHPYPITAAQKPSQNTLLHFRDTFLSLSSNYTLSTYLRNLTLHPHLAGTPPSFSTAAYVHSHFQSLGLHTHANSYSALLSYPIHSSLSAHFPNRNATTLHLSEPGSVQNGVVIPYHAYSPSGSVYAMAVFVNYGRAADYDALAALGVEVKGCVAILRRGNLSRNAAVEKAAESGAAAVLMYTEGVFRGGVERGTVNKGLGDPLTPGWPSDEGGERLDLDDSKVLEKFPAVPSMPVSADTAEIILRSLEGCAVPFGWRGTLKRGIGKVGPGPTMLNFSYQGEKKMATIHNVFSIIRGFEEPDRFVLLGNHRDAWTYGAVDPNSGTAALLDIARRYAILMRLGWTPRRTIILASWDAEEFGMVGCSLLPGSPVPMVALGCSKLEIVEVGSTEWVEQNLVNLGSKAIAYLNVDCAVQGPGFFAGATPQLDDLLVEVTKKVDELNPEGWKKLYEKWAATNDGITLLGSVEDGSWEWGLLSQIHRLGGIDSDFAPFLQHAGVPSIDLYFGKDFPVYHTAFDSYGWMTSFADPIFQRHVAVTGVWGLLALHLADDPVLPFNYLSYSAQLQSYTNVLRSMLEGLVSLHPITDAIQQFEAAAKEADEESKKLGEQDAVVDVLVLKKRTLNDRLMFAERGFLDAEGLEGRKWFKHLIYGPCSNSNSKLVFFPGIVDAMFPSTRVNQSDRQAAIQHEIWRVARAIERAAYALKGELT
ncbi:hypothetical protein RJ639_017673 [Escallonia herrerae]|uniref:glutamate carboxypeptidase II n=1 Tax=Escallonia herrerae TaxID=1293975 RepID=A0AA89AKC8_9ASTE|nr:hypothetical protein RJ639_017673 [Escallonia herrerae]